MTYIPSQSEILYNLSLGFRDLRAASVSITLSQNWVYRAKIRKYTVSWNFTSDFDILSNKSACYGDIYTVIALEVLILYQISTYFEIPHTVRYTLIIFDSPPIDIKASRMLYYLLSDT
nr:hypothetical protein [Roseobacter litoralis]